MADWIDGPASHRRRLFFVWSQSPVICGVIIVLILVTATQLPSPNIGWIFVAVSVLAVASVSAIVTERLDRARKLRIVAPILDMIAIGVFAVAVYEVVPTASILVAFPVIWLGALHGIHGALIAVAGAYAVTLLPVAIGEQRRIPEWTAALVIAMVVQTLTVIAIMISKVLQSSRAAREASIEERKRIATVMRAFATEVDLGLLYLDADGNPLLCNQAIVEFGKLARHGENAIAGSQVFAANQVTPLTPDEQPLARILRGETFRDYLYWVGPGGGQRALLAHGRPIPKIDGEEVGSILVVQDVTQLIFSTRERGDAFATLAHELRTPLTSIIGQSELLLNEKLDQGSSARVDVISRNADYLITLTETFLDGLRHEARLHREQVILREVVDEAIEMLEATPGFVNRNLRVIMSPVLAVLADRVSLRSVVVNLLNNATKFSGTGDRITLTADHDHVWVWLVVHNTGSHIDDDDLERIFSRFYRGANAQRDAVSGTGVGLSVSRQIATAHGGTLVAERVDEGASFLLRLPRG